MRGSPLFVYRPAGPSKAAKAASCSALFHGGDAFPSRYVVDVQLLAGLLDFLALGQQLLDSEELLGVLHEEEEMKGNVGRETSDGVGGRGSGRKRREDGAAQTPSRGSGGMTGRRKKDAGELGRGSTAGRLLA